MNEVISVRVGRSIMRGDLEHEVISDAVAPPSPFSLSPLLPYTMRQTRNVLSLARD